eukprot:scaffold35043_cov54-Phaeocystis_antarctica.AAC.1
MNELSRGGGDGSAAVEIVAEAAGEDTAVAAASAGAGADAAVAAMAAGAGRARNGRRGGRRTLSGVEHTVHVVAPTRAPVSNSKRSAAPQPGQLNVATQRAPTAAGAAGCGGAQNGSPSPDARLVDRSPAATSPATSIMRTILSLTGLVSSLGRRLANSSTPVSLLLTSTILSFTSSPALAASPPACTAVTWLLPARAKPRLPSPSSRMSVSVSLLLLLRTVSSPSSSSSSLSSSSSVSTSCKSAPPTATMAWEARAPTIPSGPVGVRQVRTCRQQLRCSATAEPAVPAAPAAPATTLSCTRTSRILSRLGGCPAPDSSCAGRFLPCHRPSGDAELHAHGPELLTLPPDASSAVGEAKPPGERGWCGKRVVRRGRCKQGGACEEDSAGRVVRGLCGEGCAERVVRRGGTTELWCGGAADLPTSRRDLSRSPDVDRSGSNILGSPLPPPCLVWAATWGLACAPAQPSPKCAASRLKDCSSTCRPGHSWARRGHASAWWRASRLPRDLHSRAPAPTHAASPAPGATAVPRPCAHASPPRPGFGGCPSQMLATLPGLWLRGARQVRLRRQTPRPSRAQAATPYILSLQAATGCYQPMG